MVLLLQPEFEGQVQLPVSLAGVLPLTRARDGSGLSKAVGNTSWNSQCSYAGDIHLEAQQTGAKGVSSPSIQAVILTLCSTAIHSWHSNTMKMGVVKMSS